MTAEQSNRLQSMCWSIALKTDGKLSGIKRVFFFYISVSDKITKSWQITHCIISVLIFTQPNCILGDQDWKKNWCLTCIFSVVSYGWDLKIMYVYKLFSIEEECRLSTCSQTLESRNMELHASLQRMSSVFTTVESYVSLLASASTTSCECPQANFKTIYEKLAQSLTNLYEVMKGM